MHLGRKRRRWLIFFSPKETTFTFEYLQWIDSKAPAGTSISQGDHASTNNAFVENRETKLLLKFSYFWDKFTQCCSTEKCRNAQSNFEFWCFLLKVLPIHNEEQLMNRDKNHSPEILNRLDHKRRHAKYIFYSWFVKILKKDRSQSENKP